MNDGDLILAETQARAAIKCLNNPALLEKMTAMPWDPETNVLKASYSNAKANLETMVKMAKALREKQ